MARRRRSPFTLARVGAVVTLFAWLVQGIASKPPAPAPQTAPPKPETPSVPAPVEHEPAEELPPIWVTDVSDVATPPPPGGRRVPPKPFAGQKRPQGGTCGADVYVIINGGCWMEGPKRPAPPPLLCGDLYESQGRCYAPVLASAKLPNTIGR